MNRPARRAWEERMNIHYVHVRYRVSCRLRTDGEKYNPRGLDRLFLDQWRVFSTGDAKSSHSIPPQQRSSAAGGSFGRVFNVGR